MYPHIGIELFQRPVMEEHLFKKSIRQKGKEKYHYLDLLKSLLFYKQMKKKRGKWDTQINLLAYTCKNIDIDDQGWKGKERKDENQQNLLKKSWMWQLISSGLSWLMKWEVSFITITSSKPGTSFLKASPLM